MKNLFQFIFFLTVNVANLACSQESPKQFVDSNSDSNGDSEIVTNTDSYQPMDSESETETQSEQSTEVDTSSSTSSDFPSDTDSDTDSESDNCLEGNSFYIYNNLDLLEIEPFNCFDGWLIITQFTNIVLSLPNLKWIGDRLLIHSNSDLQTIEFEKLSSVPFLAISGNSQITNLDGFVNLLSVSENFQIKQNPQIPDCEVCELLAQLDEEPYEITVHSNLDDTCSPVPDNCP